MSSLVAFLDMLGTRESVRAGRFHRWDTVEFANPVGMAAMCNPDMRFAVFSDSVVVSAAADSVDRFVAVIAYLLGNWFCEFIFARGGVALGEINWVDQPDIDRHFRALRNFHYARVYGSGLVEAVDLERTSGPGAICFLSESAAQRLAAVSSAYVLPSLTPMLVWTDEKGAAFFQHLVAGILDSEKRGERYRHIAATLRFLEQATDLKKFVPTGLVDEMLGINRPPNHS